MDTRRQEAGKRGSGGMAGLATQEPLRLEELTMSPRAAQAILAVDWARATRVGLWVPRVLVPWAGRARGQMAVGAARPRAAVACETLVEVTVDVR